MCGRYHVDDHTAREIEKLIRKINGKLQGAASETLSARDIYPTGEAPILLSTGEQLSCEWMKWGFPGFGSRKVIINARSETALEKKMFREDVGSHRAVIPAAWFYEWNRDKEKNIFYRKENPLLLMAGIYHRDDEGKKFVILTTEANASMKPVHDRMPLLLEENEIMPWLQDGSQTEAFLRKKSELLERRTEFQQLTLPL